MVATPPAVLLRSIAVGLAATAIDIGALALLIHGAHVSARIANVPALALGVLAQFLGNKLFAFRDGSRRWGRQGAAFAGVEVGALLLNAFAFDRLIAAGAPFALARVAGSALVYFGFSLPLWSRIFAPSKAPTEASS